MWFPPQTVGLFNPTLHGKRGTHILMWKYPCSTFSNVEQGDFPIKLFLCENTPIKHYPMLNMKNNVWSDILNVESMRWFSHKIKSPCENTPIKMTLFTKHMVIGFKSNFCCRFIIPGEYCSGDQQMKPFSFSLIAELQNIQELREPNASYVYKQILHKLIYNLC